jgi:hypothetical protein
LRVARSTRTCRPSAPRQQNSPTRLFLFPIEIGP